jgi:ELWxxDGT repeat protein
VSDQGFSGAGGVKSFSVNIPVRVVPINSAPTWITPIHPLVVGEDEMLVIPGVQVKDPDAKPGIFSIEATVDYGLIGLLGLPATLVFDGVQPDPPRAAAQLFRRSTYKRVTLTGDLEEINLALKDMVYMAGDQWSDAYEVKNDALHLSARDGPSLQALHTGVTLPIHVTALSNDAPRVYVRGGHYQVEACNSQTGAVSVTRPTQPSPVELRCRRTLSVDRITGNEDEEISLEGTYVEDPDLDQTHGAVMEVSLYASHGGFRVPAAAAGALQLTSAPHNLTMRGPLDAVNLALRQCVYKGDTDYFGTDSIIVKANDMGFTGRGGPQMDEQSIPIILLPVNDPPSVTLAEESPYRVFEDFKMRLPAIRIVDADWDAQQRWYGNQVFNCSRDDAACYNNTWLREHKASGLYGMASHQVVVRAKHGRFMLSSNKGLSFGRLDPELQTQAQEATAKALALGAAWVQNPAGLWRNLSSEEGPYGLWYSDLVMQGRLGDLNKALAGVVYWPTQNWNSQQGEELETIDIDVLDREYGTTLSARKTVYLEVMALNDPPVVSVPGALRHPWVAAPDGIDLLIVNVTATLIDEDQEVHLQGVTVRDVDVNETATGTLTVQLEAVHGTVSLTFHSGGRSASPRETSSLGPDLSGLLLLQGTGARDTKLAFQGSVADVNLVLTSLRFLPEPDYFGEGASVTVSVEDGGSYGSENPSVVRRGSATVPITVRPLNDPPVITLPTAEDGTHDFLVDEGQQARLAGAFYHNLSRTAVSALGYASSGGFELWRSEYDRPGYDAGAWGSGDLDWRYALVRDVFPGQDSSHPRFFCEYQGLLYFQAADPVHGVELWRTDGSLPGTVMVKDVFPGKGSSHPSYLTVFNGLLYFQAQGVDTSWAVDPEHADRCGGFRQSSFDARVFFAVAEDTTWDTERSYDCPLGYHWATTEEAYYLFTGLEDQDMRGAPEPRTYYDQCGWDEFTWGGKVRRHFRFRDSWSTLAYKDVARPDSTRPDLDHAGIRTSHFAGIVCVVGEESLVPDATPCPDCFYGSRGPELWMTDGTDAGTRRVDDQGTRARRRSGVAPAFLTAFNGHMYFQAYSEDFGVELFRSGGKDGGALVKDIRKGQGGSNPSFLVVFGGLLFFTADDGLTGEELWSSDGAVGYFGWEEDGDNTGGAGTSIVRDIRPGGQGSSPRFLTVDSTGTNLFFQADDGVHGPELWVTDGTRAGTRLVKDIKPGPEGSGPAYLVAHDGLLFFQADDGVSGAELWVSDGTAAGTSMVYDIRPGSLGSFPSYLTVVGKQQELAFFATDGYGTGLARQREGRQGSQLWLSGGTAASTRKAFSQTPNHVYVDFESLDAAWPPRMATLRDTLYFPASRGLMREHSPAQGLLPGVNDGLVAGVEQALVLTDVDQEPHVPMQLTLSCSKGRLNVTQPVPGLRVNASQQAGGRSASNFTLELRGPILALNRAMRHLSYTPLPDQTGWDFVSVLARDTVAACGENVSLSMCDVEVLGAESRAQLSVYISPVNSPPTIALPAGGSTRVAQVGQPVQLGPIAVADPDAAASRTFDVYGEGHDAAMLVSISCSYGRLSLHARDGLTFLQGDGIKDKEGVRFLAPLELVNEALRSLVYQVLASDMEDPSLLRDQGMEDVVSISFNDMGTGRGGPQTTMAAIQIEIREENELAPGHGSE